MKNRNRKIIKESNAAEWEAIKEQARLEKLAYLIDVNNNSRPSSIDVVNAPDLNELEIEGIVNKYLSKIKKKKGSSIEELEKKQAKAAEAAARIKTSAKA